MAALAVTPLAAQQAAENPPPGAPPVRIESHLPEAADARARELLTARGLVVSMRRGATLDLLQAVRAGRCEVDLILGLDALYCRELAAAGHLARHASPAARELDPAYHGIEDRYCVPLLSPLVLAFVRERWAEIPPPRDYDDLLFEREYAGETLLCEPEELPALWLGLTQLHLGRGHVEDRVLAWLRTLDARAAGYAPTVAEVLVGLAEGRGSLAILPLAEVMASLSLGYVVPRSGVLVQDLAVAIVAGRDDVRVREVHDYLVSSEFAVAMAGEQLVPAPRTDLDPAALDPALDPDVVEHLLIHDPSEVDLPRWLQRWRESVIGQGRSWEWLDLVLEGGFAIVFAVFLYFVYRNMQAESSS